MTKILLNWVLSMSNAIGSAIVLAILLFTFMPLVNAEHRDIVGIALVVLYYIYSFYILKKSQQDKLFFVNKLAKIVS